MEPGLRTPATRDRSLRLMSRFSATTSMIQSASAMRPRSSSKLPKETLSARASVKKAAGLDFFAVSRPARTILLRSEAGASGARFGGTMSNSMQGKPALAKCAAIRAPIVPAPRTAALSIRRFMTDLYSKQMDGRTGYKTGIARSNQAAAADIALEWDKGAGVHRVQRYRLAAWSKGSFAGVCLRRRT